MLESCGGSATLNKIQLKEQRSTPDQDHTLAVVPTPEQFSQSVPLNSNLQTGSDKVGKDGHLETANGTFAEPKSSHESQ